jgi:hypothetical protein
MPKTTQLAAEPVVAVDPDVLPAVLAAVDAELKSAPGVQPMIVNTPAATPAPPMSLMTCRRSISVVRSNASPVEDRLVRIVELAPRRGHGARVE